MDFAALMAEQIAKKKGPSASSPSSTTTTNNNSTEKSTPKYIRKADAEAARQEAYLAEQARLEEERKAKAAAKRKREDDAAAEAKAREEKRRKLAEESRRRKEEKEAEEERARRKRLGLPDLLPPDKEEEGASDDGGNDDDELAGLGDEALIAKLRGLGEPAVLFGETRLARVKRLRRLTTVVSQGPIPTTLALVEEKDMKVDETVPPADDKAARKWLFRQLASYFTMILKEWEIALLKEQRESGSANTVAGRQAYSAMVQCKQTMTPLFRKFEKGDLDDSVLKSVVEIVRAAQERRYVDANDEYLRLSIGKAAWPIGVTMVGIHERSAREKLHNGERGHVMGDEVTRKYLQSIKRCLTFAQVRWPPEDVRQLMG